MNFSVIMFSRFFFFASKIFLFLRQGFPKGLRPRLASNSQSSYLSFPSARITEMHHHAQLQGFFKNLRFFWWDGGFELRALGLQSRRLSHTFSPFCSGYFGDGISQTIWLGWPQILLLLISASQVARITGLS
jgi:hypothetical protein